MPMKTILSRKGFDSGSAHCPSPILPDGKGGFIPLSMPIPADGTEKRDHLNIRYDEIFFGNKSYKEIWQELAPKNSFLQDCPFCHLDPDIRSGVRNLENWFPSFGQIDGSQTHLRNHGITVGDLFLFFGLFHEAELSEGKYRFVKTASNLHVIYGYLQIGEILQGEDVFRCPQSVHADESYLYRKNGKPTNNTIYVASKELTVNGITTGFPGAQTLRYSDSLVLTKRDRSTSIWDLNHLPFLKDSDITITYHRNFENRIDNKANTFQSASRGQEFVIDEDPAVTQWAIDLITHNI